VAPIASCAAIRGGDRSALAAHAKAIAARPLPAASGVRGMT
jgi:hypothetical protein